MSREKETTAKLYAQLGLLLEALESMTEETREVLLSVEQEFNMEQLTIIAEHLTRQ